MLTREECPPMMADLDVVVGASDTSVTFVLRNEGHTLGNALRFALAKHPDVEFAAYVVPHPLVPELHVRVMTRRNRPALDVLDEAVATLAAMLDTVGTEFDRAAAAYVGQ